MNTRYPFSLKQRISGPNGHLSNNTAGKTISELVKSDLKEVMLGHLSKENNFPELAYQTVVEELQSSNVDINNLRLSVADRYKPSKIIKISWINYQEILLFYFKILFIFLTDIFIKNFLIKKNKIIIAKITITNILITSFINNNHGKIPNWIFG